MVTKEKEELLNTKEVAKQLDVVESTIYEWVQKGLLKAINIKTGAKYSVYKFKQEWIDEFIERNTINK